MTNKKFVWIALLAVLVITVVIAAWPKSGPPTNEERIESIAALVQCPTCQGLSVAESDSPLAVNSREEIERRVAGGQSDQEIKDYFVSRYGPSALLAPERSGFALLVWVAPVVFGLIAVIALSLVVRKWRSQPELPVVDDGELASNGFASQAAPTIQIKQRSIIQRLAVSRRTVLGLASVVALVISVLLVVNATQRGSNDEITGGFNADSNTLLREASSFTAQNQPVDALKRYDAVLQRDPDNAEALAYRGWLIRLAGANDEGFSSVDKAIKVAPSYPDPYFFRGYMSLNDRNDPGAAATDFEKYLSLEPSGAMSSVVQSALTDARARIAATQR